MTATQSPAASSMGGGRENSAPGSYAVVPGGQGNRATGNSSFAAGTRAQSLHRGTIVLSDSADADFASVTNDSVLVQGANGVGINANDRYRTVPRRDRAMISQRGNAGRR